MAKRRPYPSDLSDARWELVEPVLAAWRFERRGRALDFGRPPEHDLRDIMDAILYVDRTGVQWRYLPHDFPHWNTVYGYFAKWADEGVFAQLNGLLRQLLREKEGRDGETSACVIDAQSVKTSTSVPAAGQGIDAGKKIVGRKRSIVTDTLGLLLAVLVTAASVQDSIAGTRLLDQVAADHPGIRRGSGQAEFTAFRTVRYVTPYFRSRARIDTPARWSRRIAAYSSTFVICGMASAFHQEHQVICTVVPHFDTAP